LWRFSLLKYSLHRTAFSHHQRASSVSEKVGRRPHKYAADSSRIDKLIQAG
jgi:hypothetical protein